MTASFTQTYLAQSSPLTRYLPDVYGSTFGAISSPAVGDVTGDGIPDIVVGENDGNVYVYRATDGLFESTFKVGDGPIVSSPTLADLNGDGVLDILVGIMPTNEKTATRTIGGFTWNGGVLFSKLTNTYQQLTGTATPINVFSSIVVADLEGTGRPDIIATSQDQYLHAWRMDGSDVPGFPVRLFDTSWSTPVVADLYGNGHKEVIVASDSDYGTSQFLGFGNQLGGFVRVISAQGQILAQRFMPGVVPYSSPAVGDLLGNGHLDVIIGSSPQPGATNSHQVNAFDSNLNPIPGWPVNLDAPVTASPALAHVPGSNALVVVISDNGGNLYVLNPDGSRRWTVGNLNAMARQTADLGTLGSPAVADVDGDGTQEVVAVGESTLRIFNVSSGALEWEDKLWTPANPSFNILSVPTVFSLNGLTRIAVHTLIDTNGDRTQDAGDRDGVFLYTTNTGNDLTSADWPTFHHDFSRGGLEGPAVAIDALNRRYVAAVYQDVLGWAPDAAGLDYWTGRLDAAAPLNAVAQLLTHSAEYFGNIIAPAYAQFLGRAADAGGLAFWTSRMQSGLTDEQLEASFIGSNEYYQHTGGTNPLWVDAMYQDLLGHAPDPSGEVYWVQQLTNGVSRTSVAFGFAASAEREGQHVQQDYQHYLGRTAAASEVNYWVSQFGVGVTNEAIITGFVASEEYFQKHTQP